MTLIYHRGPAGNKEDLMIVVLKSGESISTRKPLSFKKGGTKGKRWFLVTTRYHTQRVIRVKDVLAIKGGVMKSYGNDDEYVGCCEAT